MCAKQVRPSVLRLHIPIFNKAIPHGSHLWNPIKIVFILLESFYSLRYQGFCFVCPVCLSVHLWFCLLKLFIALLLLSCTINIDPCCLSACNINKGDGTWIISYVKRAEVVRVCRLVWKCEVVSRSCVIPQTVLSGCTVITPWIFHTVPPLIAALNSGVQEPEASRGSPCH